jgi:small subunit ribosomal protein S1
VDGFVPATQLSTGRIKNVANHFPVDSDLVLKVIEFDKENKKIVLSATAALKEESEDEIQKYIESHKLEKVTPQDIKNTETTAIDTSEFPIFEVPEESHPQPPAESK